MQISELILYFLFDRLRVFDRLCFLVPYIHHPYTTVFDWFIVLYAYLYSIENLCRFQIYNEPASQPSESNVRALSHREGESINCLWTCYYYMWKFFFILLHVKVGTRWARSPICHAYHPLLCSHFVLACVVLLLL